jgi:hypothetical protein
LLITIDQENSVFQKFGLIMGEEALSFDMYQGVANEIDLPLSIF